MSNPDPNNRNGRKGGEKNTIKRKNRKRGNEFKPMHNKEVVEKDQSTKNRVITYGR